MAAETDFEGSLKVVRQTLGEKLGFRRRAFWFVLHDNVLSWHPRRGEPAADFFLLQDAREIAADGQTGIVLHTDRGQALLLAAPSLDDREKWLIALRKHSEACKGLQASATATSAPTTPGGRINIGSARPTAAVQQQQQQQQQPSQSPPRAVEQFLASVRESTWSEGDPEAPEDDENFLVQLPAPPTKPPPRPVVEASVVDDVPEPPPQQEGPPVVDFASALAASGKGDEEAKKEEEAPAEKEEAKAAPPPEEPAEAAAETKPEEGREAEVGSKEAERDEEAPTTPMDMSSMLQSVTFTSLTESAMASALKTSDSVISPPPAKEEEQQEEGGEEVKEQATETTPAPAEPTSVPQPTPPLVPIDKDDYAVISLPINLELVLKSWPSQARGIVAGGIVIDRSKEGAWTVNPRGRLRYTNTREEELRRIEEEKRRAVEREDYTLAAHLLDRKKELEARPEPPMASFKLSEYITLCFRDKEWALLRPAIGPRSEQQADDDAWTLAALPGAISRAFASASVTIPQAFSEASSKLQALKLPHALEGIFERTPIAQKHRPAEGATTAATTAEQPQAATAPSETNATADAPAVAPSPTTEVQHAVLVAHVEKAVTQIIEHFSKAPDDDQRRKAGDDRESRQIAILVRGVLCTALAELLLNGFKSERFVKLLPPFHLWDWIEGFNARHSPAVSDITALSLRKCIANMNTLHTDKNLRFRGFVCYALNAHLLAAWMQILADDASQLKRFFLDTAAIRTPAVAKALVESLGKLTDEHFLLSLNFESQKAPAAQQAAAPDPKLAAQ